MNTLSHSTKSIPTLSTGPAFGASRCAPTSTHTRDPNARPAILGQVVFFLSVISVGLFAGCASIPVPDVATHYDPYTHLRTDLIPDNELAQAGPAREVVWLNASRVFKDQQYFEYYLEVRYAAREETGLLNINPGLSLSIVADGREYKFRGSGSLNTRKLKRNLVSEDAIYIASADELKAIATAKQVTVKIVGQNGVVVRDFGPPNFERFRKFVAEFVDKV